MLRFVTALLLAAMIAGCCRHIREYPADWTSIAPADRLKEVPDHVLAAAVRKYPGYAFSSAGATMVTCRGIRWYHLHGVDPEGKIVIVTFDPDGTFVDSKRPEDGT